MLKGLLSKRVTPAATNATGESHLPLSPKPRVKQSVLKVEKFKERLSTIIESNRERRPKDDTESYDKTFAADLANLIADIVVYG